mmetsp:Transcript_36434/g.100343  ORF Transcript_36434/g.100343 Transcript_36434/m.100343 type:complete len:223 (+) Transcript_36434:120-788(+)
MGLADDDSFSTAGRPVLRCLERAAKVFAVLGGCAMLYKFYELLDTILGGKIRAAVAMVIVAAITYIHSELSEDEDTSGDEDGDVAELMSKMPRRELEFEVQSRPRGAGGGAGMRDTGRASAGSPSESCLRGSRPSREKLEALRQECAELERRLAARGITFERDSSVGSSSGALDEVSDDSDDSDDLDDSDDATDLAAQGGGEGTLRRRRPRPAGVGSSEPAL